MSSHFSCWGTLGGGDVNSWTSLQTPAVVELRGRVLLCCGSSTLRICGVTLFHASAFSLNLPLDQSVCVVPVWPWQSFPCRWSSAAGSFRCAAARRNIKRWSCDIVHPESGWTSQSPSLNGWLTGRYAAIKQETQSQMTCKIPITVLNLQFMIYPWFFSCVFGQKLMTGQAHHDIWPCSSCHSRGLTSSWI